MNKEYTKLRQFYAWIGFITLALIVPALVYYLMQ